MNSIKSALLYSTLAATIVMTSCIKKIEEPLREEAWVPIYENPAVLGVIKNSEVRAPIVGGKIYAWEGYLFQLEPNKGIHVYQLVDQKAEPYSFIQVYGAQEISIRNNVLYTNNYNDIVSIDVSDLQNVAEVGRVENVFEIAETMLPPEQGYFQCVDPEKGNVIGWELQKNIHVKCRY